MNLGVVLVWQIVGLASAVTHYPLRSKRAASFASPDLAQYILEWHNEKRALVAKGELPKHPPASNMKILRWSESLASKARRWAEKCDYKHQKDFLCGTDNYHALGENIAIHTTTKPLGRLNDTDLLEMVNWALNFMWDEYKYWTFGDYPSKCRQGIECGHYTQMVWAETEALGCALVECGRVRNFGAALGRPTLFLVCKYGPAGNIGQTLPYNTGPPCSQCAPEMRSCSDGALCNSYVIPPYELSLGKRFTVDMCLEWYYLARVVQNGGDKRPGRECSDAPDTCARLDWSSRANRLCWDCKRWKREGNCDPCKNTFLISREKCPKTCGLCKFDYSLDNQRRN